MSATRGVVVIAVDSGFAAWQIENIEGAMAVALTQPRWCFSSLDDTIAFLRTYYGKPVRNVRDFFPQPAPRTYDHPLDFRPWDGVLPRTYAVPPPGAAYDAPPQRPTAVDGA